MQKMSGADLYFAVAEMKGLEGRRIAKVRKTDSGIFLFRIGSEEMLFQPGVRLHLTRQVFQGQEKLDGFVAFMRKNFEGKTAAKIAQHGTDRIVEIGTKSKERLVFELFRKGNIVAVGEDGVIAAVLHVDEAGGRRVARGERYEYPKATAFELKIPAAACFGAEIGQDGAPSSYSLDAPSADKPFASFSDMADFYYANQNEESGEQAAARERVKGLLSRLESQEKALERLGEERERAKKAGGAVYANFAEVDALLSEVRRMKRAGMGEEGINAALSQKKARVEGASVEAEF